MNTFLLALPSPSPTGRPVGEVAVESPKFWLAVLILIGCWMIIRAFGGFRRDE